MFSKKKESWWRDLLTYGWSIWWYDRIVESIDKHFWDVVYHRIQETVGEWHAGVDHERQFCKHYIRVPRDSLPPAARARSIMWEAWTDTYDRSIWAVYYGNTRHAALLACYAALCENDGSGPND